MYNVASDNNLDMSLVAQDDKLTKEVWALIDTKQTPYKAALVERLFNVMGDISTLPAARWSKVDRGAVEAIKTYGQKTGINLMIVAGMDIAKILVLLRVARSQSK